MNNDKPKNEEVSDCVEMFEFRMQPHCHQKITEDSFALAFYGLEADKKKKRKICTGCHGKVNDQHQQLIEKLVAGESVLSEPL